MVFANKEIFSMCTTTELKWPFANILRIYFLESPAGCLTIDHSLLASQPTALFKNEFPRGRTLFASFQGIM